MKILAISDFHGSLNLLNDLEKTIQIESPDVVCFSGDIVKGYSRGDEWLEARSEGRSPIKTPEITNEVEREKGSLTIPFFKSLQRAGKPTMIVPGNMDSPWSIYLRILEKYQGIHSVHLNTVNFQGYGFLGYGGSFTEDRRDNYFQNISRRKEAMDLKIPEEGRRVLLTHQPPDSILGIDGTTRKGSIIINDMIKRINPIVSFCGHAHSAQGEVKIGKTVVINPGALKARNYAIVQIEQQVNVEFRKL